MMSLVQAGVPVVTMVVSEARSQCGTEVSFSTKITTTQQSMLMRSRAQCVQLDTALHILSEHGHVHCIGFILTQEPDLLAEDAV